MTITFANHKGGTGKTTSVINIGVALTHAGKKVLLVDLDPQGNLSYSLGIEKQDYNVADLMLGRQVFEEVACEAHGMHVLPSDGTLYKQMEYLGFRTDKNYLLKNALKKVENDYDFILLDCAPALSLYTTNAFNASGGVIIPLMFEILSIQGLDQILEEIKRIQESSNPALTVIGVMGVIVNESRKLSEEVLEYIRENYKVSVFNNHIRNNVKAAEAPSFASSVIEYAPNSTSAKDYINVTKELLSILETRTEYIN